MAASEITGHFFAGPIAKNILKGVLLQHVKFHAFIIKWTIPSYITTSQPNYIDYMYPANTRRWPNIYLLLGQLCSYMEEQH